MDSAPIGICGVPEDMKTLRKLSLSLVVAIAAAIPSWRPLAGAETNAVPEWIGLYDSRAVAYAHFWSEPHQREISALVKSAREARASGQTERYQELNARLKREQERNHLQVFSTAPVDDLLAAMKDRMTHIQKEAGVARLVSKWDSKTLAENQGAQRVDVTDRIVRVFKLTEKQMKMVGEIQKTRPLPLDKAEKLMREGKL